jgi:hypothetical protein
MAARAAVAAAAQVQVQQVVAAAQRRRELIYPAVIQSPAAATAQRGDGRVALAQAVQLLLLLRPLCFHYMYRAGVSQPDDPAAALGQRLLCCL